MPRPVSERFVRGSLQQRRFKPAGIPARELEEVTLSLDGAEAVCLADLEGLYQEAAAQRMGVSRQTFGRIVEAARRTIADAIINGKSLRIEGGDVVTRKEGDRMMKVAVPSRAGEVDGHFGHCEGFAVFSLDEKGSIVAEESVASPAGCGCRSNIGGVLARMGVTHLVAGNMGEGAVRVLQANGISVTRGASGNARQAVERFAAGKLADSGTPCAGHAGGHGAHGHGHAHGQDCGHGS
jgi:predicted DNA-binding protein (UPF0251 family)/predicted Fe-Mo cluster-binding NifX family protein